MSAMLQRGTSVKTSVSMACLDSLDYRCFRQIKDPKNPLRYLLPTVKISPSNGFAAYTYVFQLDLMKLTFSYQRIAQRTV